MKLRETIDISNFFMIADQYPDTEWLGVVIEHIWDHIEVAYDIFNEAEELCGSAVVLNLPSMNEKMLWGLRNLHQPVTVFEYLHVIRTLILLNPRSTLYWGEKDTYMKTIAKRLKLNTMEV